MKILDYEINVVADTFWSQLKGLMFSKPKTILFKFKKSKRHSFWMFGVRFPIKILFLDENYKVIEEQRAEPLTLNIKSWRVYKPKKICKYVLEIPISIVDKNSAWHR